MCLKFFKAIARYFDLRPRLMTLTDEEKRAFSDEAFTFFLTFKDVVGISVLDAHIVVHLSEGATNPNIPTVYQGVPVNCSNIEYIKF